MAFVQNCQVASVMWRNLLMGSGVCCTERVVCPENGNKLKKDVCSGLDVSVQKPWPTLSAKQISAIVI